MKSFLYYILYGVSLLVSLLPLKVLYILSDIFYYLNYYILRYRKKTVFTNLRSSFPEKSGEEIEKIAKKFYRHLGDLFVESLKILHLPDRELQRRIRLKNPEILESLYSRHTLVLVAMGHYNNWEWISMMTRPGFKIISIYKPLHNQNIDRFMLKLRTKRGSVLVPTTQTLRFLSSWNEPVNRAFFCFIADQSPLKKDFHYWTKFLNQSTPIFVGIEKIAVKMNLPVCYFSLQKIKRGYYELEIIPTTETPANTKPFEITETHVRLLEKDIRRHPEYWLWSHRRWKRKLVNNEIKINPDA
jgi:KDO2-lipid IV(A) lauroyltransferase